MILRDDISIFEAIGDAVGLLGKAWQQIALSVGLNLIFAFILIGNGLSWLFTLPALIVGLYLNLNVMVKIKSIYEKTDKEFGQLLREAFSYLGTAIMASILAGILMMLVGIGIGLLALIFAFFSGIISAITILSIALLAYMVAFVVQGVVLGDLDIGHAFETSKDIFKDNLLKFLGLGVLTVAFSFLTGDFEISTSNTLLAMIFSSLNVIYIIFTNIVLCVIFYQATKCYEKNENKYEVFEEVNE